MIILFNKIYLKSYVQLFTKKVAAVLIFRAHFWLIFFNLINANLTRDFITNDNHHGKNLLSTDSFHKTQVLTLTYMGSNNRTLIDKPIVTDLSPDLLSKRKRNT